MKRRETISMMLVALSLIAMIAIMPAGAAVTNATVSTGEATTYAGSDTAQSATATGGYITPVDITSNASTSIWQGYYGNLTGSIVLANAGGNIMYSWTLSTVTGQVYAAKNPTMTASNWTNLTVRNGSQIDSDFDLGTSSDNATNTFTSNVPITVAGVSLSGDDTAAKTYDNVQAPVWNTVAMANTTASADNYVFAGVINKNSTAFDSSTKDFQMIVPAKTSTTYYFYLELT